MEKIEYYINLIKMHNRPWSDFEKNVFAVIFILTMAFCIYGFIKRKLKWYQSIGIVCFAVCMCFLYATTIFTRAPFGSHAFRCMLGLDLRLFLAGVQSEWDQVILNIILFMPFGLLLPVIRRNKCSICEVAFIGLVLSLSVEITQYITMRGVMDVEDVLTNVIGAFLGGVIAKIVWCIGTELGKLW